MTFGGRRTSALNLALLLASALVGLVAVELAYRAALFTDHPAFDRLRRAHHFADYYSEDDYWKLHYHFAEGSAPPPDPHPLLGWIGAFSGSTYVHDDAAQVGDRRPVLLFGDSFAACVDGVPCFEDVLNGDSTFATSHYLLNYGVGGYGVDQIFLLMQQVIGQFEDPLVIVSLMTLDLDRSVLSVRVGQKPFFTAEDGELQLRGIPVHGNPHEYFAANPPSIRSYVYRRMLFGVLPRPLADLLRGERSIRDRKRTVNAAIVDAMLAELRAREIPPAFLIFSPESSAVSANGEDDWREAFLEALLARHEVPVLWSRDVYRRDDPSRERSQDFFIPGDGHPTGYFNRLIAEELGRWVRIGLR